MVDVRRYDAERDREGLWSCKRAFEESLGARGDEAKAATYAGKLTEAYRDRYLAWVARCVSAEPGTVQVAADGTIQGYVFVLPERHAMIWDAAVLNEIFVAPEQRGTGLADDLLESAVTHARDQDLPLDRMVLDVDPTNDRAQAFYTRHDFEPWGELVARQL
jgi:ribosomal protein S18 acetylase RimI-like enzyme